MPKDLRAFVRIAEECGEDFSLLREVDRINRDRVTRFVKRLKQALWVVKGKVIGVLGLAFKPDTDDIREAPSLRVIKELLEEGAVLRLYDPQAMENMKGVFPEKPESLVYTASPYEAAEGSHVLATSKSGTHWEPRRSGAGRRSGELPEGPVVASSPFGGLSLHLLPAL